MKLGLLFLTLTLSHQKNANVLIVILLDTCKKAELLVPFRNSGGGNTRYIELKRMYLFDHAIEHTYVLYIYEAV